MHDEIPPSRLVKRGVKVISVLEEEDRIEGVISDILQEMDNRGSTYIDRDGDKMFCYAFSDNPDLIVQASEQTTRSDLNRWFHFEDLFPLDGLSLHEK